MKRLISCIAVSSALLVQPAVAAVPSGQAELVRWWSAAQELWIGEDAYKAAGTQFDDGVCKAQFNDGIIIPVYSGKPPLSEGGVGVCFNGAGELEMRVPSRRDARACANHMVGTKEETAEEAGEYGRKMWGK